jgi:Uma2 family endonuclease
MLFIDKDREAKRLIYPESDGEPMSDNTRQAEWIVTIFGNLRILFHERQDVFVAMNHLIYPIENDPKTRIAPDVYVAFGRPKGHRGSYRVFDEEGIFPQVVFEILSPSNTSQEMAKKRKDYFEYGAEECYIYNPDPERLEIWIRGQNRFERVPETKEFLSPRLGINFDRRSGYLIIRDPDGEEFLTFEKLGLEKAAALEQVEEQREIAKQTLLQARRQSERDAAEIARQRKRADMEATNAQLNRSIAEAARVYAAEANAKAEAERAKAEAERAKAEAERAKAEAAELEKAQAQLAMQVMREKLKAAGIDPDAV